MHSSQRYAAVVVSLVVVGYVTVAALQILVWNPLAAVPRVRRARRRGVRA